MSSKKYRGKTCVYCADAPASGGDHVFARSFFLDAHRADLPQVPACDACNGRKSTLEHYAATILPFGGRHPAAMANLQTMVPQRLDRNERLRRQVRAGMSRVLVKENSGLLTPTSVVPLDGDQIEQLFAMIGRGLLWHHYGALMGPGDVVDVVTLNPVREQQFDELFAPYGNRAPLYNLGDDTVIYQGFQTTDCSQCSVWRIRMYGGLVLASSTDGADSVASTIGIITAPKDLDGVSAGPNKGIEQNARR